MEGGLTQKMAGDYEMVGHGSKFGRKKEEAIAALLTQRNVEEAAKVAGIGTNTLWRWMRLPELQAAYRKARRDAFSQSIARSRVSRGRFGRRPRAGWPEFRR